MTLRAILFDFDGVLVDTEPLHFEMFQKTLKEHGIELTREDYYEKYLGLDDRTCFKAVFRDSGAGSLTDEVREGLVKLKNKMMLARISDRPPVMKGVKKFLEEEGGLLYLAIVSGALRSEIEAVLRGATLESYFKVIVAAEDVSEGKPSPEGFLKAVRLLNRDHVPESEILLAEECLAIEDSPWGIDSAHRAGVRCAAVTTSYPAVKLQKADWIFPSLEKFDLAGMAKCYG